MEWTILLLILILSLILIYTILKNALLRNGISVDGILFFKLSGLVIQHHSLQNVKKITISSIYISLFTNNSWVAIVVEKPTLFISINPSIAKTASRKSIPISSDLLKYAILFNLPFILSKFSLLIKDASVLLSLPADKSLNITINQANLSLPAQLNNKLSLSFGINNASFTDSLNRLLSTLSIDISTEITLALPIAFPIVNINITPEFYSLPITQLLATLKKPPNDFTSQPSLTDISSNIHNLFYQSFAIHPQINLNILTPSVIHQFDDQLSVAFKCSEINIKLTHSELPINVKIAIKNIIGSVTDCQETFHILALENLDFRVSINPPILDHTTKPAISEATVTIKKCKISVNNLILEAIKSLNQSKNSSTSVMKRNSFDKTMLLFALQTFPFDLKIQFIDTDVFFSVIDYSPGINTSFRLSIALFNSTIDSSLLIETENSIFEKQPLGKCSIVATKIYLNVLENIGRDILIEKTDLFKNLGHISTINLKLTLYLEEIEKQALLVSLFSIQFQCAVENFCISLSDIKDNTKADYKSLLLSLKSSFKPSGKKATIPFGIDGAVEFPHMKIDCRSDIPGTGVRLELIEVRVGIIQIPNSTFPQFKIQMTSISLISFQTNKHSDSSRSIKNVALKIQAAQFVISKPSDTQNMLIESKIDYSQFLFAFVDIYILIISTQHLIRLSQNLKNLDQKELSNVNASVNFDKIDLTWNLSSDQILRFSLSSLKVNVSEYQIMAHAEEVLVFALVDVILRNFDTLATLRELQIQFSKSLADPKKCPFSLNVESRYLFINVAHNFHLSHIFEHFINIGKVFKILSVDVLNIKSNLYCKDGNTCIKDIEIPYMKIQVEELIFTIQDDPFEKKFNSNFIYGFEEQAGRIARDKAFERQVSMRQDYSNKGSEKSKLSQDEVEEIEKASELLKEFNSKSWIETVKKMHGAEKDNFSLLTATAHDICIVLKPPTLPKTSVEKSLTHIDYTTPANLRYEELIPRDIEFSLSDLKLTLRDYPTPLLCLPKGTLRNTWISEGLFILVNTKTEPESSRSVVIELGNLPIDPIIVERTLNPVKIYMNTKSVITTSKSLRATWGAAMDPCLADMIRIIDTFNKETIDVSPPVGWWDKMRLILHGKNTITITGGGEIRIRVLGSFTPYFDARKHSGIEGIDLTLSHGVRLELGGDPSQGKDVVAECGQLVLSIPTTKVLTGTPSDYRETEDVFARFEGGVRMSVGIRFQTAKMSHVNNHRSGLSWKRHCDISLKNPAFCDKDNDSYDGFRSVSLHLTVDITSPRPLYHGLSYPVNSLYLTTRNLNNLGIISQIYQSVLTNQPIRTGPIYSITNFPKPKLGRMINSIRVKALAHPLLLGYLSELEDLTGVVGVRGRSEGMNVDIRLTQRQIETTKKDEINPLSRKSITKWNVEESEVEMTKLEICTFSVGFEPENELKKDHAEAEHLDMEWLIEEDFKFAKDINQIKLFSFIRSPKLSYYRRKQLVEEEQERRKNMDLYDVQIKLFRHRLREIESSIWEYLQFQQTLESRMAVFFDDSLKIQSQNIVDQLAILYEKKNVLEEYIQKCENRFEIESTLYGFHNDSHEKQALFNHSITVHNVNFLWLANVRNVIFKLFDLIQRNSSLRYCTSYSAAKQVAQTIGNSKPKKVQKQKQMHQQLVREESAYESTRSGKIGMDQILKSLLLDVKNALRLEVNDEIEDFISLTTPVRKNTNESGRRLSKIVPDNKYKSSEDSADPDFVSNTQIAEGDLLLQLIHPQVSFESSGLSEGKSFKQSVIVASDSIQFKSVSILEKASVLAPGYDEQDKPSATIKTRHVYSILNAQFLVVKCADDSVFNQGSEEKTEAWPFWVPIECLLDHLSDTGRLERVVNNTTMQIHRDKHNPLFVQENRAEIQDTIDTLNISFSDFETGLTSENYLLISDIIASLLIYNDPGRGRHRDELKKMILILDQAEDISRVLDSILGYQEKIKRSNCFLDFEVGGARYTSSEYDEVRKCLVKYQNDLLVLMEAFNTTRDLERKKKSLVINSKFQITIDRLAWGMLDETGEFCRLILGSPRFESIHYEDSSSSNTLEIDILNIENTMTSPQAFKDILSPYLVDRKLNDFRRNKMLRVFWKEIPPVAGIQVFHHFEINMFPLLIQMTFEVGKQFMIYFFPNRGVGIISRSTERLDQKSDSTASSSKIVKTANKKNEEAIQDLKLMQNRATQNRSFIYVKVPGVEHCVSYKGSKEKNLEDLYMFPFRMPTLEYRNKTWSWFDFIESIKRDAIRVIFANTGALVREKIFQKKRISTTDESDMSKNSDGNELESFPTESDQSTYGNDEKKKSLFPKMFKKKMRPDLTFEKPEEVDFLGNRVRSYSEGTEVPIQESNEWMVRNLKLNEKAKLLFGKYYPETSQRQ